MTTNLPNALTLCRIAAIPVLVAAFYLGGATGNWIACGVFVAASITDFLDGYAARRLGQHSAFGRFLDPVADKLLVAAALLMMTAYGRIAGLAVLPALVILCREILVSGLREYLAGMRVSVPVSYLAKWKTAIQMTAIAVLLLGDAAPGGGLVVAVGEACLWIAALLTLATGYDYLRSALRHIREADAAESKPATGRAAGE